MTNYQTQKSRLYSDVEDVRKLRAKVAGVLQIYDQILGKQKYIGGASFTIADLYHMPHMITLAKIGEGDHLWKGLLNVKRWYQEISEREAVKVIQG